MKNYLFSIFILVGCATKNTLKTDPIEGKHVRMTKELNLSDKQALEIMALRKKYKPMIDNAVIIETKARENLDRSMLDGNTSREEFRVTSMAYKEAQIQKSNIAIEFLWNVRSVLTDDQRIKFFKSHKTYE